jgi:hydrogenase 3 maturation protease
MKYLIVCIGNREGGDDAVGPIIADKLKKKNTSLFDVLDTGIIPENYTKQIKEKKPETLIIIDAVDMQLEPGEIRIIPPENIGVMHVSTHGIPLPVFIQYLEQYIKKIILIGIQPKNMYGEMSKSVKNAAYQLIKLIQKEEISKIKEFEK